MLDAITIWFEKRLYNVSSIDISIFQGYTFILFFLLLQKKKMYKTYMFDVYIYKTDNLKRKTKKHMRCNFNRKNKNGKKYCEVFVLSSL